ncbi:MAG: hypothetical protein A2W93_00260 [Bacteroidetes bacterium GWF2_43_63]|nr:MAG: hypothetical protein A2W94_13260 [Bacteroidetes bacterium GWE2_42_42]OFY53839.1 MAG: hypothetical protein A2W93_00260 [Bacteroidetes bacterium GWF2_43_63]HBG69795.1 hypothetical protein [Bacteroidales bacterium]HCB61007.1 hypothetical protein [Bacteroidales bacterium]HCY24563.1 hypothetical protein [Bacteroidales bacterium]
MYKTLLSIVLGLMTGSIVLAQSLSPIAIASSGGYFSNGSGSLSATVAEMTMVETFHATSNILTQGFQQPADAVSSIDETTQAEVSIFPNPTNGQFSLTVNASANGSATVRIYDLLGQTIREQELAISSGISHLMFDIRGCSAGIYMLYYRDETGSKTIKFNVTNN